MRFDAVRRLVCNLLLCSAIVSPSRKPVSADDRDTIRFLEPGQSDPILDEIEASLDEITVREINEFHLALLDQCVERTQRDVQDLRLSYSGIVAIHDGASRAVSLSGEPVSVFFGRGQRAVGSIGNALEWQVLGDGKSVYFSVWISVGTTKQTVTEWDTGKRTLYVNLSFIDGDWKSRDERRPELGGRSIVEFLNMLQEKVEIPVVDD